MIIPKFKPKDNIEEYLYNNFNLAIFDLLEPFENPEEGINRLEIFNLLYEQYEIVVSNKSKPNSIINHLLKLNLPARHLYLLFILLIELIRAAHKEATDDLQDNSMHICAALIIKEANKIYRKLPAKESTLVATEILMIKEGYYWMAQELEKLPDYKSKMTFLIQAKAEYLRKVKLDIGGHPSEEVPPNEVYDIEMNKLKNLEELKAVVNIPSKPPVNDSTEINLEDNVIKKTTQDESFKANPLPDPKLHQTRKAIEAEFNLMHKNQRWKYAFNYESEYNAFVELLVKFFEAKPFEIPGTTLRLKNDTKARVGRALRNLHKDLKFDGVFLREDKEYFKIIKVLNHFEKLDDMAIYNAITK